MADILHSWLTAIICSALICALAISLTPKGRAHSAMKLLCGLVMITAIISPLKVLDLSEYSECLTKYSSRADELAEDACDYEDKLNRTIIEDECAAYILDKAESYGAKLNSVSVTAEWSMDGFWYPCACDIVYSCSDELMSAISFSVEAELGITKERQTWMYG